MKNLLFISPLVILSLAAATRPLSAEEVYDSRRIICTQPCTLLLKAAEGFIEVKVPTASATLKTLVLAGDSFELDGGKDYVLKFNESPGGFFSFDLQFTPKGGGSAWACTVKTIATPPFIKVDPAVWSGQAGQVEVNTDRAKPFLVIRPSTNPS